MSYNKYMLNMNDKATNPHQMKNVILHTTEPVVIKDKLDWELLHWDLKKWQQVLGDELLKFRKGKNGYTKQPQFENTTDTVSMTFTDFLKYQESHPQEWLYFDYKYLREWLMNIPELRTHINWTEFGFHNRNVEDSTIWIGSKGAHTPCHVDTYGCNVIAQIYGRKRWILFPPNEKLRPTRVPYEESSIYSKINIFSPSSDDFKDIAHCRTVVLNPGDVLILPHRWWHYVENVELAISINTWIELPIDYEERIGESLALTFVSQIAKQLNPELQQYLLNPVNTIEANLLDPSFVDTVELTTACLNQYKMRQDQTKLNPSNVDVGAILQKFKNIEVVEQLSEENLKMLLDVQRKKFEYSNEIDTIEIDQDKQKLTKVINAMLHGDVLNLIKAKLLED